MGINEFINAMYYMYYYGSYNATYTNRIKRIHIIKRKLKVQKREEYARQSTENPRSDRKEV